MNDTDRLVRRIKRWMRLFTLLLILLVIGGAILPIPLYVKLPLLPVLALVLMAVNGMQLNKRTANILLEELDPLKYHYVMHRTGLAGTDAAVDVSTACAVGDYLCAIRLCYRSLELLKKPAKRIPYLLVLARCFFELGDAENLRRVLGDLSALLQDPKRGSVYRKMYGDVLDYYEAYGREDFDACKRVLAKPAEDKRKNRYSEMNTLFLYGMTCYRLEETQEAAEAFATVAKGCPRLHIGKIAQDHLDRIARGDAVAPYRAEPIPTGSLFPVRQPEQVRRNGVGRWIVLAVCVCVLILSISVGLHEASGTPMEVLSSGENVTELYGIVPVNEEGDALCLYAVEEEGLFYDSVEGGVHYEERILRVAYLNRVGEDTYRYGTSVDIDAVSPHATYEITAGDANLRMTFRVMENLADIPEGAAVTEFSHGGRVYYFCLLEVAEKRCVGYRYGSSYDMPEFAE